MHLAILQEATRAEEIKEANERLAKTKGAIKDFYNTHIGYNGSKGGQNYVDGYRELKIGDLSFLINQKDNDEIYRLYEDTVSRFRSAKRADHSNRLFEDFRLRMQPKSKPNYSSNLKKVEQDFLSKVSNLLKNNYHYNTDTLNEKIKNDDIKVFNTKESIYQDNTIDKNVNDNRNLLSYPISIGASIISKPVSIVNQGVNIIDKLNSGSEILTKNNPNVQLKNIDSSSSISSIFKNMLKNGIATKETTSILYKPIIKSLIKEKSKLILSSLKNKPLSSSSIPNTNIPNSNASNLISRISKVASSINNSSDMVKK